MDPSTKRRTLVVIGLLVVTALVLAFQEEPRAPDETGVRLELPGTVGNYLGRGCLFCQNQLCARSLSSIDDNGEKLCKLCGSQLSTISIAEKTSLPPDTVIVKKRYVDPSGESIFAMVVATGKERRSIHRPETCLPAQGNSIERSRCLTVDIPGRRPLKVMLLDLRSARSGPDGTGQNRYSAYAYWFVSPDCETPYHIERIIRTSTDRAFRGISYRWAYISVYTNRRDSSDDYVFRISQFIADLYPKLVPERGSPMAQPLR